jgi:pyruvate dehydrogenase E2 component (dihydrolipoamide acetyltransferase)
MAADFGLNLEEINGTGKKGMITREDISRFIRHRLAEGSPAAAKRDPADHLSGLRSIIARRLTDSWNQRPQVTINSQLDASALVKDRERRKASGETISYNTYLIKASALALAEWPQLNVYLTEDALIQQEEVNIGLAVDTERGLMVPVLKNVHTRTIQDLNQELLDLVERTLVGKLLPEEYSGGSLTVTNLGGFGVDSFSPIINPPESAILGVGRIVDQPVVKDGAVRAGKSLTLSLSFDHRVIDGAPAAQFLARIVEILIDPAELEKF